MNPLCELCGGWCCRVVRVPTPTVKHIEWLDGRTAALSPDTRHAFLNCACSYLRDGKCAIHADKPDLCREPEPGGKMCMEVLQSCRPDLHKLVLAGKVSL